MKNVQFSMAVVTVSAFNVQGREADKNGAQNIYMTPIAGQFPQDRNVLAGTVAQNLGLEIGKTYVVNINEIDENEYGRQFTFQKIGEVGGLDIFKNQKEFGKAVIVPLEKVNKEAAVTTPNVE